MDNFYEECNVDVDTEEEDVLSAWIAEKICALLVIATIYA